MFCGVPLNAACGRFKLSGTRSPSAARAISTRFKTAMERTMLDKVFFNIFIYCQLDGSSLEQIRRFRQARLFARINRPTARMSHKLQLGRQGFRVPAAARFAIDGRDVLDRDLPPASFGAF